MAVLRVDIDGVAAAAGQVAAAPAAGMPAAQVTAAASDPVSVGVAHAVGSQIAMIGAYTAAASVIVDAAGARLRANAADYGEQEHSNAAGLGFGGAPAAAGVSSTAAAPTPPMSPSFPPPQSATAPTNGKHIAALIHGGPASEPLHSAASRLRRHADALQDTSFELQAAADSLDVSWFSAAGTTAQSRLLELAGWYDRHAQTARTAAERAATQGDNVTRARSAIPRPEEFEQVESRLQAAMRANAQSKGAYSAVVAQLQSHLGALNAKALSGYTDYTVAAATGLDAPLSPPHTDDRPAPGPDDVMVDDATNGRRTVQAVDFKQDVPQPPPPAPVSGGSTGDAITDMMLPPAGPAGSPVAPDAVKGFYDQLVGQLAQRPPTDPLVLDALRRIYEAQHEGCNGWQWAGLWLGLGGSTTGLAVSVPALAVPPVTIPAALAVIGSAAGFAGSLTGIADCATK